MLRTLFRIAFCFIYNLFLQQLRKEEGKKCSINFFLLHFQIFTLLLFISANDWLNPKLQWQFIWNIFFCILDFIQIFRIYEKLSTLDVNKVSSSDGIPSICIKKYNNFVLSRPLFYIFNKLLMNFLTLYYRYYFHLKIGK